jgi:hypothetical protein
MDIMSFITLVITFFLVLLPYFVYNIPLDVKNSKQHTSFYLRKYIDISLFFSFFFLLLFSIYKKQNTIDVVNNLSSSVNIKFIFVSYLISFFIQLAYSLFRNNSGILDTRFNRLPTNFIVSLLIFFFLINIAFVLKSLYGNISIEQFIFHLSLERTGANYSIVTKAFIRVLVQTIVIYIFSMYVFSAKISNKNWGGGGVCSF